MKANETIWLTHEGDTIKNWEGQVFYLGNSYFGASCYGGTRSETFTLSEKTFWIGGPGDSNPSTYGIIPNKDKSIIDEIKKLTSEGNITAADSLVYKLMNTDWEQVGALSTIGSMTSPLTITRAK